MKHIIPFRDDANGVCVTSVITKVDGDVVRHFYDGSIDGQRVKLVVSVTIDGAITTTCNLDLEYDPLYRLFMSCYECVSDESP